MKKFISALLAVATMCFCITFAFAEENGFDNFKKAREYGSGTFVDVSGSEWYSESVGVAYELGLVNGSSNSTYSPSGNITLAETLALACRLNSIYRTGTAEFVQGSPWYAVYVKYAQDNNIISQSEYSNYDSLATRAQFASIMAKALPEEAFPSINTIPAGKIPDINSETSYSNSVYLLYRAGVLTGNDGYGTFTPNAGIERSAVAALVSRIAVPVIRKTFSLQDKPVYVTSVAISNISLSLYIGGSMSLTATVYPTNATDKTITWASSDSNIVSVNNGTVFAYAAGSAIITATTNKGVYGTCNVTVTKQPSISAPTTIARSGNQTMNLSIFYRDHSGFGFYQNSAGGICVGWCATNLSGKTINYYTCYITMYNSVGDLAYDSTTGKATRTVKTVGPLANGDSLLLHDDIIGYAPSCSKIVMDKVYLEYSDGTSEMVPYGYAGYETLYNKYYNKFIG